MTRRPLRIGYFPYGPSINHPGNRRRFLWWARKRGHKIFLRKTSGVDVIFNTIHSIDELLDNRTPRVFEVIDGYIVADSLQKDIARLLVRGLRNPRILKYGVFHRLVIESCATASTVVCSSPEQRNLILPVNRRCFAILDSHDELPELNFKEIDTWPRSILWEGKATSLPHFVENMNVLHSKNQDLDLKVNLVTDSFFYKYMDKYLKLNTANFVQRHLSYVDTRMAPWSVQNLVNASERSNIALLPMNSSNSFLNFKPENRLLMMFRLGLPALVSPTQSHLRLQTNFNSKFILQDNILELLDKKSFSKEWSRQLVSEGKTYLTEFHNTEVLLKKWDEVFSIF